MLEIDLHGLRYEEAQEHVERFVIDNWSAGAKEITIIHGRGSGALKRSVLEILERLKVESKIEMNWQDSTDSRFRGAQLIIEFK